ncbi:MAG: RNA chaperone Hfq [Geobacter sp.]|nr:RNA chaperone Hfq [Geobacter sp.]
MKKAATHQFVLQEHKLNEARKEGHVVTVTLMDGSTYTGLVTAFDMFVVEFITPNPVMCLVFYKHAIASIKYN